MLNGDDQRRSAPISEKKKKGEKEEFRDGRRSDLLEDTESVWNRRTKVCASLLVFVFVCVHEEREQ